MGTETGVAIDHVTMQGGRALSDVAPRALGAERRYLAQKGWGWELPEIDNEKLSLRG